MSRRVVGVVAAVCLSGSAGAESITYDSIRCTRIQVCGADAQGTLNCAEFGMKMSSFGAGEAGKTLLRIRVEGSRTES